MQFRCKETASATVQVSDNFDDKARTRTNHACKRANRITMYIE